MRLADSWGRLAAAGLLLILSIAVASAAELTLQPVHVSDQDLQRIVPVSDHGFACLHNDAIDLVSIDGAPVTTATSGTDQRLYLGDQGTFIGLATHRVGAADFAPTASFELRNGSGEVIWRIGATEDVTYSISATGTVVGMQLNVNIPDRNRLHFYGEGGDLLAEIDLPNLTGGRFDDSGTVFFAQSMSEGLVAFDGHGSEIWRVPSVRLFDVSPDGNLVAAVGEHQLLSIVDGVVVANVPLGDFLVRRVAIAPDGSRIAIAGKHEIVVHDGADLGSLFRIPVENPALSYTSVDIGKAGGWLVAGVARDLGGGRATEERHPDGEVRAYDAEGHLIHNARMEFPAWNIWTPTAILGAAGSSMTVTTRRAIFQAVLP